MTRYALLSCFLLFAGCNSLSILEHKINYHELPTNGKSELVFSSNYSIPSAGSNDGKRFSVVHYEEEVNLQSRRYKYLFNVCTFDEGSKHVKNCSFILDSGKTRYNSSVSQVTELANGKLGIVLHVTAVSNKPPIQTHEGWKQYERGEHTAKVIMVDTNNCMQSEVFSTSGNVRVEVPKLRGNLKSEIVVTKDDTFVSTRTCGNKYQCFVMGYNAKSRSLDKPIPLVADLRWNDMKVDRLIDEELLISGFKDGNFQAVKLDESTGKTNVVMSLFDAEEYENQKTIILNSGLTFCWIVDQGNDQEVQCARYDEKNRLIFAKTIKFGESVTLTHVHATPRGEIFIITGPPTNCKKGSRCWLYTGTKVHPHNKLDKRMRLPFLCNDSLILSDITYDEINNTIGFKYACKYKNGYSHNQILVDFDDDEENNLLALDRCIWYKNGWKCL